MSIMRALFGPDQVTDQKTYWTGVGVLLVLGAVIAYLPLLFMGEGGGISGMMKGGALGMLLYLLIYPWFCLIGGRLRDAGHSPWYFLLGFFGYAIVSGVLGFMLMAPEMAGMMEGMMENMPDPEAEPSAAMNEMMDMQAEMMRKSIPKQIIAGLIASLLVAIPFGLLKPKADGNNYNSP